MKNFKKLFAVAASVMMLASTLPTSVLGASYSDELQGAYDYAYGIGITTQSSIDNANMYGNLLRSHMAKMMVNYAKEVLGKTADTSLDCEFTDIANQTEELQGYIKEACQLGLMGVGVTAFNPTGLVTRAQFGTVLSRALYGDTYNGGDPYYADHLAALKDAGIMNNISNPNALEVRGYVMLMMQRAAGADTPAVCDTPENALSCSLGLDTCPAQCQTAPNANGNLNVSMTSIAGGDIPYSISSLPVVTYKFTADEDIRIDSLVLKRMGYFTDPTVKNVALFVNGGRISKVASFSSTTDEATVTIANGYQLKAGETLSITVHVTVGAVASQQFSVKLLSVGSTAKDVNLASNLTSQTFKTVSTASPTVTFAPLTAVDAPKLGENGAEIFEFSLAVPTSTELNDHATLKAITFKDNTGTIAEATDLENFKLIVDGTTIATASKMVGKYLIFNVADGYDIKEGRTPTFTVKADVIGGAGKTVNFLFDSAMDLVVMGDKYDQPLNVAGTSLVTATVTVSAGKVTLNRINPPSTDLLGNKNNVFLGAFEIVNNAGDAMALQTLKLSMTGDVSVLDTVKVRLGSTTASPIELTSTAGGTARGETTIEKSIGSKLTVYVYADTIDTGMDSKTLRMSLTANNTANFLIEETADDTDVTEISPSSLTWTQMVGKDANLTLTNVVLGAKTVSEGTEAVEAMNFKIKAGTAYGVKIKKLTFTAVGVDSDTISNAVLYKGTTPLSAEVNNGNITANDDVTIAAGETATFSLKVDIQNNPELTGITYNLLSGNVEAEDMTDDRDPIYTSTSIVGRTITVSSAGTLQAAYESTADNNKYNKNILAGETSTVAEYSLYSKYEKINIKKAIVNFNVADVDNSVLDVKLFYNGTEVASNPTWDTTGQIATFTDLNFDTELATAPLTVKVISKAINENGGAALAATSITSIVLDEMKGKDSGDDIAISTTTATSKTFAIVPVTIVPSVPTVGTTAADFVITAANNGNTTSGGVAAKATLTSIVFTVEGNNGALTTLWVKDDAGTTLGSGTVGGTDGDKTVTLSKEVSNGATTLRLTTTVSGSITNPSYGVAIKSIVYTTNVAAGNNNAQFGGTKSVLAK